jgi:hypothetical protein
MIAEVNSEFKAAKREARKQRSEAQSATKLEKVVQPDNFSKPTSTISTDIQSGNADTFQKANPEKVVQPDNFSKLSPLEKVVSSDNFQPRIKYIGNKKGKTDKKTARGRSASKDELDGRTDGKADRPTDQLTDYEHAVQQAIIETGIPAELGDTPGPAFCKEAARRLNGAPVQWLKTRMKARRKAIIENGLGLILNLCDDAAKTYRDLQNRAKPPASETRALDDPLENLITDLEFYRACPEHPDANGEALQKLQKDNPELYAAAEAELQRRNQQAQGAIA